MADLLISSDLWTPGVWQLECADPRVLAAVCDAVIDHAHLGDVRIGMWGRHYDEQSESIEDAYAHERSIAGGHARVEVIALAREPRPHHVWIDRLQLAIDGALPGAATQLLGLYVGSRGSLVMSIHAAHVQVFEQLHVIAAANGAGWDDGTLGAQSLVLVAYDETRPATLVVRTGAAMAQAVNEALMRLQQHVRPW